MPQTAGEAMIRLTDEKMTILMDEATKGDSDRESLTDSWQGGCRSSAITNLVIIELLQRLIEK